MYTPQRLIHIAHFTRIDRGARLLLRDNCFSAKSAGESEAGYDQRSSHGTWRIRVPRDTTPKSHKIETMVFLYFV
jgi:hypothetical protein